MDHAPVVEPVLLVELAELELVEELFEDGNQEVGLSHYEVRSWTGWHHHMTLSLLALWFLQLERLAVGKKKSRADGVVGADDLCGVAAASGTECA